jgi:hypothetical protein
MVFLCPEATYYLGPAIRSQLGIFNPDARFRNSIERSWVSPLRLRSPSLTPSCGPDIPPNVSNCHGKDVAVNNEQSGLSPATGQSI